MPAISVKKTIHACCPGVLKPTLARIEASEIGYRLAKGAFWSVAGTVISRGLALASSIVVARTLGKSGFGELGIIHSTLALFQLFAGFGLGMTATKYVAQYRKDDPEKAGRIIGLSWMVTAVTGGLCALLLAVLAPWLATRTLAAPHLSGLLRITAIGLFLTGLNAAQNGALSGFEAFRAIATRNAIAGVLNFPVMISGVLLAGVKGVVWATVVSCAINWLICHVAVRREARRHGVPLTFAGCWEEMPLLWRFSLPAVLSGLMVMPVSWACTAMLVNEPNGYEQMGIFSAANQWYTLALYVPTMLGGVLLPILSDRLGQNQRRQVGVLLRVTAKMNVMYVWPLVALVCLASPYVMSLYGESFRSGWPTLVAVLVTAAIRAGLTPVGQVIAASGRMWMGLLMNSGWAITYVAGTLLLVHFGSFGLATARAVSYVVHATWTSAYAVWLIRESRSR